MRRRLQTYEATSAEGTGRPPVGPPGASPTGQPCALVPKESRRRIVAPAARAGWVGDKFPDAALIRFGHTTGVRTQIAKTTPCKVEWPGSQHSGRLRPGHEMVRRHGTTHLLQSPATARGRDACPVLQTESPGASGANAMLSSEPLSMRRRIRPALPKPELLRPGMQRVPHSRKARRTVKAVTKPVRDACRHNVVDRWSSQPSDKERRERGAGAYRRHP